MVYFHPFQVWETTTICQSDRLLPLFLTDCLDGKKFNDIKIIKNSISGIVEEIIYTGDLEAPIGKTKYPKITDYEYQYY